MKANDENHVMQHTACLNGLFRLNSIHTLFNCIKVTQLQGIQTNNKEFKLSQYADDTQH